MFVTVDQPVQFKTTRDLVCDFRMAGIGNVEVGDMPIISTEMCCYREVAGGPVCGC